MNQILVYGDSLSWGIIPDTRSRFRFDLALVFGLIKDGLELWRLN